MIFGLGVLLSLLICGVLLIWPWRKRGVAQVMDRDALNKTLYQQRLNELHEEQDQGLISDHAVMVHELQRNLLQDIPETEKACTTTTRFLPVTVMIPGFLLLVAISASLYWKQGGYSQVQIWQQVSAELPALRARVTNPQATALTTEEMTRLALGLRTELENDPYNIDDWMLLGQVGLALNDAQLALQAWERAYRLAPQNMDASLGYAQILTRSSDSADNQEAIRILREILAADHANLRALSLLAFNAFEQGNFKQAIAAWQTMLKLLPPDDSRAAVLQRSIAQAQAQRTP